MQLELIDAPTTEKILEETGLTKEQVDATYSADTVGMECKIRNFVTIDGSKYFNGGCGGYGNERRWEMHRLYTHEEFKNKYPNLATYERYGDLKAPYWDGDQDNPTETGFYCGLKVGKGRDLFRVGPSSDDIIIKTLGYDAASRAQKEWMEAGCPMWDVWMQDHLGGTQWSRPYEEKDEAAARKRFEQCKADGWSTQYPSLKEKQAVVLLNPNGEIVDAYFPVGCDREKLVSAMGYFLDDWTDRLQLEFIQSLAVDAQLMLF